MLSLSPQHISNILKSAGFTICSDRLHEGSLISRNSDGNVRVSIQSDNERRALVIAEQTTLYLTDLGYTAIRDGHAVLVLRDVKC